MSGHALVAGFQGGKFITTLSTKVYVVRTVLLIKQCAESGKRIHTLFLLLQRYDPSDVFNADETGLYWRLMPDKTHAVSGETCTGGKKSKERITLLVCANMTGEASTSSNSEVQKPEVFLRNSNSSC